MNLGLLYKTNVFMSNIQIYFNYHLKHKFLESYKYLPKTQSGFSLKSFLVHHFVSQVLLPTILQAPTPCFPLPSLQPQVGAVTTMLCTSKGHPATDFQQFD